VYRANDMIVCIVITKNEKEIGSCLLFFVFSSFIERATDDNETIPDENETPEIEPVTLEEWRNEWAKGRQHDN